MEFQDKVLKCVDCGTEFIFTAGEQLFLPRKQFEDEPRRCKNCKSKRVACSGCSPCSRTSLSLYQGRNPGDLFRMWKADYRPFPTDTGTSGILPRMLPGASNSSVSLIGGHHKERLGLRYDRVCPDSL